MPFFPGSGDVLMAAIRGLYRAGDLLGMSRHYLAGFSIHKEKAEAARHY
jgi:hypothetical protein